MARFLITTVGSGGDIHPFIAIGIELASRGHQVEMLANPYYQLRIAAAGLGFRGLGTREQLIDVLHHPHLAQQYRSALLIIRELIERTIDPTIEGVRASLREFKPDLVVRHHISLGSRWVAQTEKIPCITCVLAPVFWFSRLDGAVSRSDQMENAPPWLMRLRLAFMRTVMRFLYDRPINAARRRHGFLKGRDFFRREIEECDRVLGLWSSHYRAAMPDDPPNGRICGFAFHDRANDHESGASEVRAWIDECAAAGEPPIVFTLGTSVVHHHNGFYEQAVEACRLLGKRALLLVGDMANAPALLPPTIRAFAYAPFTDVFPHAAAIVHHGGVGTTAEALRAGRPTVIIPFANDEFDNARRAKKLGCSATLHTRRLSAAALAKALRSVLETPTIADAAKRMGAAISAEHGASVAADEILAVLAASRRPPTP